MASPLTLKSGTAVHRLLLSAAIVLAGLTAVCEGHGYLFVPRSRNVVAWQAGTFYDPQSGNGLGLNSPPQVPGVCGDPFQGLTTNFAGQPTPAQGTYATGGPITLNVKLTANHGGKFSFRVCPRTTGLDESCFGSSYLLRADNGQKDTWIFDASNDYTMQYVLPAGISCSSGCVLQWTYTAMQSCIQPCDRAVCGVYADGMNAVVGNRPGLCGANQPEYFVNCADIIIAGNGVTPSPTPTPTPTPAPTPSPSPSGSVVCNGCTSASCYCRTAPAGNYPNPYDSTCSTFLQCSNGVAYTQKCPAGLVYDRAAKVCNWPAATTCTQACP